MDISPWVARLERLYHHLVTQENGRMFILEAVHFLTTLEQDPVFGRACANLLADYLRNVPLARASSLQRERADLGSILRDFRRVCPPDEPPLEIDRSQPTVERAEEFHATYTRYITSLQYVEDTIEGNVWQPGQPVIPGDGDETPEARALGILLGRIDNARQQDAEHLLPELNELFRRAAQLQAKHVYEWREYHHRALTSPGTSLWYLSDVRSALNPHPVAGDTYEEWLRALVGSNAWWTAPLRQAVYAGGVLPEEVYRTLRAHLARLNVHLRNRLDEMDSYDGLVNRFKQRAMWYDRERLRHLALGASRREDVLVDQLALFLCDQGLPPLVRHRYGGHEPDVVAGPKKAGLLVEAKAYVEHCRRDLIYGIAQLLSYVHALDGTEHAVRRAYYVVFRLDGPLYGLPDEVEFAGRIVVPVLIDLEPGGGRRRRTTVPISAESVLAVLEAERGPGVQEEHAEAHDARRG